MQMGAGIAQSVVRFVSRLARNFCRVGSSPARDSMTRHVWMVGSSLPVAVVSQGISQSLYNWKLPGLSSTIKLSSEIIVRYDWFRVIGREKKCWKFLLKKWKLLTFIQKKNIRILYIESAKTVNEMILNELVKLMMFWITGPWLPMLQAEHPTCKQDRGPKAH